MRQPVVDPTAALPASWDVASLGEIALLSPKPDLAQLDENDQVHFVPMAAVAEDFGGLDASQTRRLAEVRKGYTYFSAGDVLLAKITPCMENGKGALVPPLELEHAFGSTEFHVLRPAGVASGKWIAHYLSQPDFRRVARHNMTGTAGQLRVPSKWLAEVGIPLAPLAEQTRIVEKLEELLSDLDAGVAELKAAQRKLAQYRQSLLKSAVEGALTADWRARNAPRETGAELLQRILRERRARWEQKQLAKFAEQGKTPPKDWRDKYPEPVAPDTTGLPALPEGWVWATYEQVSTRVTVGHVGPMKQHYVASGVPFLRSQNVRENRFSAEGLLFISREFHDELSKSKLRPGDIVVVRSGSVGVSCVIPDSLEEANCSDLVLIQEPHGVLPLFGAYFMNSAAKRDVRRGQSGIALTHFNTQAVAALRISVPPFEEQERIVEIVAENLAAIERLELDVANELKLATAQRKNLLRAAFAGQLVPQDPRDEPAGELLARIRAARAGQDGKGANPRCRRRKETV